MLFVNSPQQKSRKILGFDRIFRLFLVVGMVGVTLGLLNPKPISAQSDSDVAKVIVDLGALVQDRRDRFGRTCPDNDSRFKIDKLVFGPGNSAPLGSVPTIPGVTVTTTLYHTQLEQFSLKGEKVRGTGLDDYEITAVAGYNEFASGVDPQTGAFLLRLADEPFRTLNFFELYLDETPDSNHLEGKGFKNGTLLLRAEVTNIDARLGIKFDQATGQPVVLPFDLFRQDNYPGQFTVAGQGADTLLLRVTYANPKFFKSKLSGRIRIRVMTQLPLTEINPSQRFWNGDKYVTPGLAKPINGLSLDGGLHDFQVSVPTAELEFLR